MESSEKRPWGKYTSLLVEGGFQVKRMEIDPGLRFSLQTHARRAEKWVFVSGAGIATVGDKEILVARGSVIEVGLGQVHRMHNTGKVPLIFIEVQLGDYLGEDDIVRLEDDFRRK
jgi:mannose-6-phosphate isomerase-like protein (cupin superfamily)